MDPVLQHGMNLIHQATEEDMHKNYKLARDLYLRGAEEMLRAAEHEIQGQLAKDAVREKCHSYSERAEKIRLFLEGKIKKLERLPY